jgi:hypothetical protein
VEKRLTPEEADAYFQEIVRKIPFVREPAKLEELSLLALAMMLRRASSRDLRDELSHQIRTITASVTPGHSSDATGEAMRMAARGCMRVLQVAKERRRPRDPHPHPAPKPANRILQACLALAALMVVAGAFLGWKDEPEDDYDPKDTTRFVEQIIQSAQGDAPATHMFGGTLEVSSMNGVPVVIAKEVPRRVCAASGMRLVKKGLLSVNGDTPSRISSAIITELCNRGEGDATMMWAATK